jgi:hypothetical protein
MSRAVPLSRIQELGIRGRDDPAAEQVVWNVIKMDDGSLRGLHQALNPTLLLLALAGYRIDQLVLGPPDANGDVLLVDLSPRAATRSRGATTSRTTPWSGRSPGGSASSCGSSSSPGSPARSCRSTRAARSRGTT